MELEAPKGGDTSSLLDQSHGQQTERHDLCHSAVVGRRSTGGVQAAFSSEEGGLEKPLEKLPWLSFQVDI